MKRAKIPSKVEYIIEELEKAGYEAYIVGGCVRDLIMNKDPQDYDITTSATPEETMEVFKDLKQLDHGLKHGTVNIILGREHFEITTHRVEEEYTDNRRPDKVTFVRELDEDLKRRDFTMNALAYSHKGGIEDPLKGRNDIEQKIIRAVGVPEKRFKEDALRILRGLRFASVLEFTIEENTKQAMLAQKKLLSKISKERITLEIEKLLKGPKAYKVLVEYQEIFEFLFPSLIKDPKKWQESAQLAQELNTTTLKLIALLENSGKTKAEALENTKNTLNNLRLDNKATQTIIEIISFEGKMSEEKIEIKKNLHYIGEDNLNLIIEKNLAKARMDKNQKELEKLEAIKKLIKNIIDAKECVTLKALAIKGDDLIKLGIPKGKELGMILEQLLEKVIKEEIANQKHLLEKEAKAIYEEKKLD